MASKVPADIIEPASGAVSAIEARAINASTPGLRTSEFWLALAVIVSALVLTLADKITGEVGLGSITATGVGYAVSRGIAKS